MKHLSDYLVRTTQIGTLIRRAGHYYGDAACLTEGERTVSFREFDAATDRLGNALLAEGLAPGDRVTLREPGGGGFGPAKERPREMVIADIRNGFVTAEAAKRDYGVEEEG